MSFRGITDEQNTGGVGTFGEIHVPVHHIQTTTSVWVSLQQWQISCTNEAKKNSGNKKSEKSEKTKKTKRPLHQKQKNDRIQFKFLFFKSLNTRTGWEDECTSMRSFQRPPLCRGSRWLRRGWWWWWSTMAHRTNCISNSFCCCRMWEHRKHWKHRKYRKKCSQIKKTVSDSVSSGGKRRVLAREIVVFAMVEYNKRHAHQYNRPTCDPS